jgi:hypothetical protein
MAVPLYPDLEAMIAMGEEAAGARRGAAAQRAAANGRRA